MRLLRQVLHKGIDEIAARAYRLRPLHPLRLRVGPLHAQPNLPAGGIPDVEPVRVPLKLRPHRITVPSPVKGLTAPNDKLTLHIYPPRGPSKGVVVLSPFWLIPAPWALATYIGIVRRMGMHAVVYTPPEHMDRTPEGYFSGERLLGWDFPHMETLLQAAAAELIAVTRGLKEAGKPVYLVGLSLGGLYAAMAALGGAAIDGLALITPAADMQESMANTTLGRAYRKMVQKRGEALPPDELLTRLGIPYRARSFDRPLPADRIFLAHGEHDTVVPMDVARELADRWAVPLHSYDSGHMSLIFMQPRVRRDLRRFLGECLKQDTLPVRSRRRIRPGRDARRLLASLPAAGDVLRVATTLGGLRTQ